MVDQLVDVSGKDTAVSRPIAVLLITQDDAVAAHTSKLLQNEHPIWGAFVVQVSPTFLDASNHVYDVILLDWVLVVRGDFDTAVIPQTMPVNFIISDPMLAENVHQSEYTDFYLLNELHKNNLPRIIKKSIKHTALLQKERQQRIFAEALRDVSSSLNETLDFNEVLDRILVQVERVVPYDKVNIMLVVDDNTKSVRMVGYENHPEVIDSSFIISETPSFSLIIESRQGLLIPDVLEFPGWVSRIPSTRSWLCAPVLLEDKIEAFICLDKKEPNFYQPEHLELLSIFAGQVGLAMGKAKLYSATHRQVDELSALHALALAGAESRNEDDLIERATQIIGQSLYPDNFGVLLLDDTQQNLITHPSYQLNDKLMRYESIPVTQGIVGYVVRTKRPYHSSNLSEDEHYIPGSTPSQTEMCVPLFHGDEVIGVINVESERTDAFSDSDKQLMITLAHQLSVGIERIRLFSSERKRRKEAEILREAAIELTATKDIDTLLAKLLDFITRFVTFDSANVMLMNDRGLLEIKAVRGYAGRDLDAVFSYTFAIDETPTFKQIYETQKSYLIKDTKASPDWDVLPEVANVRSWLGVPFVVGGEVIGCYSLDKLELDGFSPEDVRLAEALASQTAVSLHNIQLLQVTQQAVHESNIANTISQALNAAPNISENFPELSQSLQDLTNCQFMSLFLFEPSKEEGVVIALDDAIVPNRQSRQIIKTTEAFAVPTVLNGDVHYTPDISREIEGYPVTQMLYELGIRSRVNIPLISGNTVLGSLDIGWSKTEGYRQHQIPLLMQIANIIAHTVERSRLFEEVKEWTHYLTLLHEFSRKITEEVEVEAICQTAVSFLTNNLNYLGVSLLMLDGNEPTLVLQAIEGENKEVLPVGKYSQQLGEGIIGLAAQLGQMIHVPDTSKHPHFLPSQRMDVKSEITFPLRSGGKLLGVLDVNSDELNAFGEEDVAILTIVSDQLANSLGNAVLFAETKRNVVEIEKRNQELIALNEVGKKLAATLDFPDIYRVMYDEIVDKTLQMSHFFVARYDEDADIFRFVFSVVNGELIDSSSNLLPLGNSIMQEIMRTKQAKIIDLRTNGDNLIIPFVADTEPFAAIYAPLVSGSRLLGVMIVQSHQPNAFHSSDLTLLTTLANQASIAIENANLFVETNQRTAELESLFNLSTALRLAMNSDAIFMEALQHVLTITGGVIGSIYLVEQATGDFVAYGNYPKDVDLRGRRNKVGEGMVGHVAATGEIYVVEDVATNPLVKFSSEEKSALSGLRSSIHLPLKTQASVVGVLNVGLVESRVVSEDEIRLLTAVTEIVGSAIQRTLMLDTLEQRVNDRTSELAYANERLKDLDRLKSKFVADVSHELRTPITNISLYLDLIAQGDVNKQERYLSVLRRQNDRLMHLIEDTLNLSRIELGRDKVTFYLFDLNEVVRSVATVHEPSAESANLQLILDLDNELPFLYGERNQMAQVVANLLANAINYTPDGFVRIGTTWHQDKEEIWLAISDSGMGIDPEDQPHLFDRFYRGREVSQSTISGTGLGLAIVKEIVDIHAGQIVIKSKPNVGTTFTVKLPIYS